LAALLFSIALPASAQFVQQGLKLVGSGPAGTPQQATSVALSDDGNTALLGGPDDAGNTGAIWTFTRAAGAWTQLGGKFFGTGALGNASQGQAVSVSADGNTAIVGGPSDNGDTGCIGVCSSTFGAVWIFTRSGATWLQAAKLTPAEDYGLQQFGYAVAMSGDGSTAIVGGPSTDGVYNTGAVWIFTRSSGGWSQQGPPLIGNGMKFASEGQSVALSFDGSRALIGGPGDNNLGGAAWVFTRANGSWAQQAKLVGSGAAGTSRQGWSVALSGDGETTVVGGWADASGAGATWVFHQDNSGNWTQQGNKLVGTGAAGNAQQGGAVAISRDGSTILAGGSNDNVVNISDATGAVWVFKNDGNGNWNQVGSKLVGTGGVHTVAFGFPIGPSQGSAVALSADGSTALVGGPNDNGDIGASWVFTYSAPVTPPVPVSVTPSSGSNSNATYTFTFSDPRGYQDLGVLNILVNNFLDGRHACFLAYVVSSNSLYLVDDAGDAGGPYVASLQNSQCAVTQVSGSGSGNNFVLTLSIAWTAAFAGDRIIYVAARDQAQNNSGWYPLGVARAPGGSQATTTAVTSVSPGRTTGLGPTQYTFTFSDTVGFADLGVENVLVNDFLNGNQACYIAVSRPGNVLFLVNDAGTALLPPQNLAAAGSVGNSQCTVSWTANPLSGSGNNLTLILTLTFTQAFDGNRVIYVATRDVHEGNSTDWHAMATQTVQ